MARSVFTKSSHDHEEPVEVATVHGAALLLKVACGTKLPGQHLAALAIGIGPLWLFLCTIEQTAI